MTEKRGPKTARSDYGTWLKQKRADYGLKQRDLAVLAGVSLYKISMLENGRPVMVMSVEYAKLEKALEQLSAESKLALRAFDPSI
jgi:transcriptional regulator with XRE-family HTH domain